MYKMLTSSSDVKTRCLYLNSHLQNKKRKKYQNGTENGTRCNLYIISILAKTFVQKS